MVHGWQCFGDCLHMFAKETLGIDVNEGWWKELSNDAVLLWAGLNLSYHTSAALFPFLIIHPTLFFFLVFSFFCVCVRVCVCLVGFMLLLCILSY